jgi:hypothetical protein
MTSVFVVYLKMEKSSEPLLRVQFYINLLCLACSTQVTLIRPIDLFCLNSCGRYDPNAEKTMYMVMSRDQNAGQNGYIQIGNKSFVTVEQFKY